MKTLLACAFGASLLGTAAVCAMAAEPTLPPATIYAGPTSISLPASILATPPATADLKPSFAGEEVLLRRPVRVVLASPYASR